MIIFCLNVHLTSVKLGQQDDGLSVPGCTAGVRVCLMNRMDPPNSVGTSRHGHHDVHGPRSRPRFSGRPPNQRAGQTSAIIHTRGGQRKSATIARTINIHVAAQRLTINYTHLRARSVINVCKHIIYVPKATSIKRPQKLCHWLEIGFLLQKSTDRYTAQKTIHNKIKL